MKNRLSLKVFLLLFTIGYLSFASAGCGYTTRSMIINKYRTIYVTPFLNKVNITNEVNSGNKYRIYRPTIRKRYYQLRE